jgi:hypothetical protein
MRPCSCVLSAILWALPAAAAAQDLASLAGTYQSLQRLTPQMLEAQGITLEGTSANEANVLDRNDLLGVMGDAVEGTLTLAANGTFSLSMAYYDEGTYQFVVDDKTNRPFLRFTGKRESFDAHFQGEYAMKPGDIGAWMRGADQQMFLIQFRKSAAPGITPMDSSLAGEADVTSMFGQGNVKVDFAEVAKGSSTGVRVAGGAFTMGARFGSAANEMTEERVLLLFLPDGRFTISTTISGVTRNGTYRAEGSELRLKLDDAPAEELWEIGRESFSGKFAIRPAGSDEAFFLEVPLQ